MTIKWLKLDVSLFSDRKIKRIRRMTGGDQMLLVWIGILCCAMKSKRPGYLIIDENIPMTAADVADEIDMEEAIVESAIKAFVELDMVSLDEFGTAEVKNFGKHQELDAIEYFRKQNADRVRRHRERKALEYGNVTLLGVTETLGNGTKTEIETKKENKNTIPSGVENDPPKENQSWKVYQSVKTILESNGLRQLPSSQGRSLKVIKTLLDDGLSPGVIYASIGAWAKDTKEQSFAKGNLAHFLSKAAGYLPPDEQNSIPDWLKPAQSFWTGEENEWIDWLKGKTRDQAMVELSEMSKRRAQAGLTAPQPLANWIKK